MTNILQTAVPHDAESLRTFEAIVSAGLESVHKSTANRFIETWNTTFGLQSSVTYPPAVQLALQKLDPFVELQLPCPLPGTDHSKVDIHVHLGLLWYSFETDMSTELWSSRFIRVSGH